MSIKPDAWIKRQCQFPKAKIVSRCNERNFHSFVTDLDNLLEITGNLPRDQIIVATEPEDLDRWQPMIEPFVDHQVRERENVIEVEPAISYGLSSYGYDVRTANEWKVFTNFNSSVVDPKNFDPKCFVDVIGADSILIPPNSFALGRTIEYFRIPRNVLTICLGKSTYARCGIIVNVTPLEPEFEGHVTLEFSNTTTLPARIYANEGVAQMLFLESDEVCEVSYKDRGGKYQGQRGVTLPKG